MSILTNQIISTVLQVLILSFIPFLWYAFSHKKAKGFGTWLGLRFVAPKTLAFSVLIALVSLVAFLAPYLWLWQSGALNGNLATSPPLQAYRQMGWHPLTVFSILLWACVQTALSEEIFFRGFLGKRLISRFGFWPGNLLQAALFGAIHIFGVLPFGFWASAVIFLFTGGVGLLFGWYDEKKAGGSIWPSWLAHALVNVLSSVFVILFLLG